MIEPRAIILGDKGRHRRSLGKVGRRIRLIVLAVAGIACISWSVESMTERTRVSQALLDISSIGHAARLFRADFGRCPTGVDELVGEKEGHSYLRSATDPWGRPYRLVCPARLDPGGVDVISGGPDGEESGTDNITSL